MSLDECLPEYLRGEGTTITTMSAGLSGAGVYRVDAGGGSYVLKVSDESHAPGRWARVLPTLRSAAEQGLTPRIVHVDDARNAVLTEFIADRFYPSFMDPRMRASMLGQLGEVVRRVHELPLPHDASTRDARDFLAELRSALPAEFTLPSFVAEATDAILKNPPPPLDRDIVLSHNDANPSNIRFDGERMMLVDWDTCGGNDPYYDLGVLSVFLRLDLGSCLALLSAYDGEAIAQLPDRFLYNRTLAATVAGTMFLRLAHGSGHAGATGDETLESTPNLGQFYQRMQSGELSPATGVGQWWFGLALIREGTLDI